MEWNDFIGEETQKDYFKRLSNFLGKEEKKFEIYPPKDKTFAAFDKTPFDSVKMVILGQDPYINPDQAQGLAFSVPNQTRPPPSLMNIVKELRQDLGLSIVQPRWDLTPWAEQGVLLLNSILTVRRGESGSHRDKGWETFTDAAISLLNKEKENLVFILWGSYARSKRALITKTSHFIIESAHPSPLSAYMGFTGSKPFSQANKFLVSKGIEPINWNLSE